MVICALFLRLADEDGVVLKVAWGWMAVLGLGVLAAWLLPRERDELRRRVAHTIDEERDAAGAVLAAAWVLEGRSPSRLGGLVVRDADRACAPEERRGSAPLPATSLTLALGLLCLSLLLPTVPSPFGGVGVSVAPEAEVGASVISGSHLSQASEGSAAAAPPPDLGEVARFEIRADRQIYVIGEEIRLTALLRPLAEVGADVPLSVVIGLADGLPSTDVGFGVGVRPVRPGWKWILAEGAKEPLEGRIELRPHLERFGLYKVGLLTIDAWTLTESGADAIDGGARSNTLTIQIAPNRKRQRIRKPEPVERKRQPKKKNDPNKDKKDRGKRGEKPPELGDPDRLPDAQRKAKAVKPLLTDGSMVDKEVAVFERERGGEQVPSPSKLPEAMSPTRSFIKSEEQAVKRLLLTPRDRRILKDYFDALRRGN